MFRILSLISLFLIFNANPIFCSEWAKTLGGEGSESANMITQTSDGGFMVASTVDSFGSGGNDILLIKLNSNGDIIWQKTYGGSGSDTASAIQQTADDGYILLGTTDSIGQGENDLWMLRLHSNGDIIWQKTYEGLDLQSHPHMVQTSDGELIVTWGRDSSTFIIKVDNNGSIGWQKKYDISYGFNDLKQTTDGGLVALRGGSFLKFDYLGNIEWGKDFSIHLASGMSLALYTVHQTKDFGYIIGGGVSGYRYFYQFYPFIMKLSSNGDMEWEGRPGSCFYPTLIDETTDYGYVVIGKSCEIFGAAPLTPIPDQRAIIAKFDSNFKMEWKKRFGGPMSYDGHNDVINSIQQTFDGGYIIAGVSQSFGAGSSDIWLSKIDPYGDIEGCWLTESLNEEASIVESYIEMQEAIMGSSSIPDVITFDTNITPQNIHVEEKTQCYPQVIRNDSFVYWQHQQRGDIFVWFMHGTNAVQGSYLDPEASSKGVDTNWKIVGIADFNGDGNPDILWQNQTTGDVNIWLMEGLKIIRSLAAGGVNDPNWRIVGTNDLNGDGKPDYLWQHQVRGDLYTWFTGWDTWWDTIIITGGAAAGGVADTNWKIVAIADFNSDGKPDYLWQHQIAGDLFIWLMNGTGSISGIHLDGMTNASWKIEAVGDLNKDDKADMLWRNQSTGELIVWLMNGTNKSGETIFTPDSRVQDLGWRIAGFWPQVLCCFE
jgi:hypothetical protein